MFSLLWLFHFCVSNIKAVKEKKTELIFWSQSVLKNALLEKEKTVVHFSDFPLKHQDILSVRRLLKIIISGSYN